MVTGMLDGRGDEGNTNHDEVRKMTTTSSSSSVNARDHRNSMARRNGATITGGNAHNTTTRSVTATEQPDTRLYSSARMFNVI